GGGGAGGGSGGGRGPPVVARGATVRGPEESTEVLRAGEAPPARDLPDRLAAEVRVGEVAAATVEPGNTDPVADAHPLRLEQLVQVPLRDEARARDLVRPEPRVAEVLLDVRPDVEQDLRA